MSSLRSTSIFGLVAVVLLAVFVGCGVPDQGPKPSPEPPLAFDMRPVLAWGDEPCPSIEPEQTGSSLLHFSDPLYGHSGDYLRTVNLCIVAGPSVLQPEDTLSVSVAANTTAPGSGNFTDLRVVLTPAATQRVETVLTPCLTADSACPVVLPNSQPLNSVVFLVDGAPISFPANAEEVLRQIADTPDLLLTVPNDALPAQLLQVPHNADSAVTPSPSFTPISDLDSARSR